jgi:hypothetical protein
LNTGFPKFLFLGLDDWENNETMHGLDGIIKQLEAQKAAIEKALTALREVDGIGAPAIPSPSAPKVQDRRSAAQKARWAAKRAAEATPAAPGAQRKGGISAAGRKKLAEAMKRRWALKRTAAQATKRGPKKAPKR